MIPGNPGTIEGKLIGLEIDGNLVSCETSCSFNFDMDPLPVSAITSGGWRDYIQGVKGWGVTVNGNLILTTVGADIKTVMNAYLTGAKMRLKFRTHAWIHPYLVIEGDAIPRNGGIDADYTGLAGWTTNFLGCGPFTTDFEQWWLVINNMPPQADFPLVVDQGGEI